MKKLSAEKTRHMKMKRNIRGGSIGREKRLKNWGRVRKRKYSQNYGG